MKNVINKNKKNVLVFEIEELSGILSELFSDNVIVSSYDGEFDVSFNKYIPDVWYDEVIEKLNGYFDIEISSIHLDQGEYPMVWICYED